MSRWVLFSCTTDERFSFFLPIAVRAWQNLGFSSLLILMGSESEWRDNLSTNRVLRALDDTPKSIVFVKPLAGYSMWTTANIVRLFAGCTDLPDDDYVIVSDIDMIILRPSYILDVQWEKAVHLWYSNAFLHTGIMQYPMCHVGMTLRAWRDVMGVGSSDICSTVQQMMDIDGKGSDDDIFFNERYFARQLHKWPGFPDKVQFISRPEWKPEYPSDRLCRTNWDITKLDTVTDSHLPRAPRNKRGTIWPVVCKVLTPEQIMWADNYWS